jgi:hypothetical protein
MFGDRAFVHLASSTMRCAAQRNCRLISRLLSNLARQEEGLARRRSTLQPTIRNKAMGCVAQNVPRLWSKNFHILPYYVTKLVNLLTSVVIPLLAAFIVFRL